MNPTTSESNGIKLSSTPKFSIVICTYNQAEALRNSLESINNSKDVTHSDIELLVIINNCTDNTLEICSKFENVSAFPFKYITEKEQGLSYARNRGIKESIGEIIIFTDDDVVVPDHWLSAILTTYETDRPDCVFGKILPDWRNHKPEWFSPPMSPAYALLDYGDKKLNINTIDKEFFGANFSMKKSILEDIGGFNVELGRKGEQLFIGEETQIFKHLIKCKKVVIYNPNAFLFHVIHENRKSKRFIKKYYKDIATSIALMTFHSEGKKFLGVPHYKIKELILLFSSIFLNITHLISKKDTPALFLMQLKLKLQLRVLYLCVINTLRWSRN